MQELLTAKQVEDIMDTLNERQRSYLNKKVSRSRKSKWLEVLAKYKGIVLDKELTYDEIAEKVDDWELIEILDGGPGNRPFKCECGTPLRIQYIVSHRKKDKIYKLGSTCFENYTGLTPQVINDVKKSLYQIDLERDEILLKVKSGSYYDLRPYLQLQIELPDDVREQWETHLPLTDKQIDKIQALLINKKKEIEQERILSSFTAEQREYIKTLTKNEFKELLEKRELNNKFHLSEIELLKVSEETKRQYQLGLPLLNKQLREMNLIREQLVFDERTNKLNELQKDWIKIFSKAEQLEILKKVEAGLIQSPDSLEGLDISEEIMYHLKIQLPLTHRQNQEVLNARREWKKKNATQELTFDVIMERHLPTLRKIRTKEGMIPNGLRKDWDTIRNMCVELRDGKDFDYGRFKILINNLIIPIRVEKDAYL